MRPLHLLGLMPPEYRFFPADGAPLMIPGSIPPGDHEILLAYYQQVVTERPLPRVEVDWYTMLLEPSRRYLEHLLEQRGSGGTVLVVKVRQQNVDLREIIEHPVIRVFEHVAISNIHPGSKTEELRTLLAMTGDVINRAEDLYEEAAVRLGLRRDGGRLVRDFVRNLESPIDVLETFNVLMEVQLEQSPPEEHRRQILQRMLIRLLEWRPAGELCGLIWLATKGLDTAKSKLGPDAERIIGGLEVQGFLGDGKLRLWPRYLESGALWEGIFGTGARLPTAAQLTEEWAGRVREAIEQTGLHTLFRRNELQETELALWKELVGVFQDAVEGKLARARERLQYAERSVDEGFFSAQLHALYWYTRGRLERSEGMLDRAEESLREAVQCAERGHAEAIDRGRIRGLLGVVLLERNQFAEAEETFREALRLKDEGGDTLTSRGIIMHELGQALFEQKKFGEAEAMLRESLRLRQEGGDTAESIEITRQHLDDVIAQRQRHGTNEAS